MNNPILKKAGQSTKDAAVQLAKKVGQEPLEMLKTAKTQVGISKEKDSDLIKQIIHSGDGESEVSEVEKKKLENERRKRIEELEKELEEMRFQRQKKIDEWQKAQEEKLKKSDEEKTSPDVLIEPSTKPKRGFLGFVKKKQGTKEMGKQVSG